MMNCKKTIFTFLLIVFVANIKAQLIKNNSRPNIIFILADDLGYADLGCYGQQKIETPFIDALAKQSLVFTQYYSGSTVCAPARTSLMTGLHTGHTPPIRGNRTFEPEGQTPLADSITTFVNILQQHGYATAAFGKWSLGFITTSGDPNKKDFDNFFGYNCQTLAHNYFPDHLWSNHQRINFTENINQNITYSADTIHAQAMQFIQQQSTAKPFFLYLPYTLPHADVIAIHDSIYNYYKTKFNELPLQNIKQKNNFEQYPHAAYAAMVSRLDKYVHDIITILIQKKLINNTLVIFCSDNGPHQENGGDPEFFKNHGIYRGIKRDLYEGGIRVPFIAYWKGKIKPNITSQWLALWDMYPTFLDIAHIAITNKIDGISILPTLLNNKKQKQHDYLYWEFHENNGRQALRWKNWKMIKLNVNHLATTNTELYDLKNDPSETTNLANKFPKVLKKLNQLIIKAHQKNTDWPLLPNEIESNKITND